MNVEIIDKPLTLQIYGFSGTAVNKDYRKIAFHLADKMWTHVKWNNFKNKGINIWVYEHGEKVFAGVELDENIHDDTELEKKIIHFTKYAYHKHIGPYNLLTFKGLAMRNELKKQGFETTLPYVEIYGHWNNDETKLETELLMSLL